MFITQNVWLILSWRMLDWSKISYTFIIYLPHFFKQHTPTHSNAITLADVNLNKMFGSVGNETSK